MLYRTPTKEQIPELTLLGTLTFEEIMLDGGDVIKTHVITYKGTKYAMKQEPAGRWCDERSSDQESMHGNHPYPFDLDLDLSFT
jgi:hypothetical protein